MKANRLFEFMPSSFISFKANNFPESSLPNMDCSSQVRWHSGWSSKPTDLRGQRQNQPWLHDISELDFQFKGFNVITLSTLCSLLYVTQWCITSLTLVSQEEVPTDTSRSSQKSNIIVWVTCVQLHVLDIKTWEGGTCCPDIQHVACPQLLT